MITIALSVRIGWIHKETFMSAEEIVEALRQWEDAWYSESETKDIMNQAADLIEKLLKERA